MTFVFAAAVFTAYGKMLKTLSSGAKEPVREPQDPTTAAKVVRFCKGYVVANATTYKDSRVIIAAIPMAQKSQ